MSYLRAEWSADLVKYIVETVMSVQKYYQMFKSVRQGVCGYLTWNKYSVYLNKKHYFSDTVNPIF